MKVGSLLPACLLWGASAAGAYDIESLINKVAEAGSDVPSIRRLVLQEGLTWAKDFLLQWPFPHSRASDYPYFGWIPQPVTTVMVDNGQPEAVVTWTSPCFSQCSAKAKATGGHGAGNGSSPSVTVHMTFQGAAAALSGEGHKRRQCEDFYALATVTHLHFFTVDAAGDMTVEYVMPKDATAAEQWDLDTKGIRILRLPHDRSTTLYNLAQTFLLFESEFTQGVSERVADRNIRFVEQYTRFKYPRRDPESQPLIVPDESQVRSGDFFGVVRFDGLDPMLGWGMGSSTGHTTVAMWFGDELYICESTIKSSYWPTDGVQRTPYRTWVKQAEAGGFNTVWVPLSVEHWQRFNETAAIEWFKSVEGLEYGYQTLLWGWIDTQRDNYPCLPPDYKSNCLTWQALETVFAAVDRRVPKIADLMWIQAWNKRLGVKGQRTADLYYTAAQQGLESSQIPAIVEQDEWMYQTKRDKQPAVGRAMVCCVFVCSLWKHAGVLGDTSINCAELTNYDDYSLQIFAGNYTQVTGDYTLSLNDFNSRPLTDHYSETCPGQPRPMTSHRAAE